MKLFKFYDYIFFRLASFYERQHGNEDRFGSILLLSFTQSANLLTIVYLIFIILDKHIDLNFFYVSLSCTIFFYIFNTLRYKHLYKYQNLVLKWSNEEKSIRFKRGFYIAMFISLSLVFSAITASFTI